MKPNTIDRQILELYKNEPDITVEDIALRLGLETNEVQDRIKILEDTRVKILVVDDNADTRILLKKSLESENYGVVEASTGYEAIEKARNEIPDLILLDLMLPGMNGYDVCDRLRKDSKTEKIPIIMLTAKDEISNKIIGLDKGADDYVTKPFHLNELKARINAALRRSRSMD